MNYHPLLFKYLNLYEGVLVDGLCLEVVVVCLHVLLEPVQLLPQAEQVLLLAAELARLVLYCHLLTPRG